MKKFVTLLLTAALAITAAATTAFAADTQITPAPNSSPNPSSGLMNVNYTVRPSYLVTIPAEVKLSSTKNGTVEGKATVTAENVTVPYGESVKVTLSSDFTVNTTEGAALSYEVWKPDNSTTGTLVDNTNNTVLEVASGSGSTELTFALAPNSAITYSGTYTGTVTFEVSVG